MAIDNPGFETEDAAALGQPSGWAVTTQSRYERAGYGDGADPAAGPAPADGFEGDWGQGDYRFEFGGVGVDLSPALYDPDAEDFDGFEQWGLFRAEFSGGEAAVYDAGLTPETVEDFEEGWDNDDYQLSFSGGVQALYGGVHTAETFESGWDNDSYPLSFAGGTAAQYDGSAPQAFEDFEETTAPQLCTVVPSTDRIIAVGHGLTAGEEVSFTNELGQLPAGLTEGAPYYVLVVHDVDTFDVSATAGGAVVDIQDYGLGTHYVLRSRRQYWVTDA